jgi:hypothetical protein
MSIPASHALDLYRGDTFALAVRLWSDAAHTIPSDLTGATAAAQIRARDADTLVLPITCTVATPNTINLAIPATAWASSAPESARWDLQVTYPSGSVRTILAGPVRILDDVTVAP